MHQLQTFECLLNMPITEEESAFCCQSRHVPVEECLMPADCLPLALLWRRLLLATEMAQQRHYRLKIEYEGTCNHLCTIRARE